MPRIPRGLHLSGSSGPNHGGRDRRPGVTPMEAFTHPVRSPIGAGTAQGIVGGNGQAMLSVGPQGVGTRWYPSQVQVSTSSGATDQSMATLYRQFIAASQVVGQTEQGGSDTLGFTHDMQPGDLLFIVWHRANPGDLATVTVHGDQLALTAAPV